MAKKEFPFFNICKPLLYLNFLLLLFFLGFLASTPARADIIYGSDDSTRSIIYEINTDNGDYVSAGRLAFGTSAIAQNPIDGQVYHLEKKSNGRLAKWNPVTKNNTIIGNTGNSAVFIKMAFKTDGTLYAMGSSDNRLFTIDPNTGAATSIGSVSGIQGSWGDIAFSQNDTMYLIDNSNTRLYAVNYSTLTATLIGTVGFSYQAGLVYSGGRLYSAYRDFISIDPSTGAGIRIRDFPRSVRITDLTTKDPLVADIAVSKSVNPADTAAGGIVTYNISINNTGDADGYVTLISDVLPTGFSYIPGSSSGITTEDPTINGQVLEWNGTYSVPRISGSATLTFQAKAGFASGTYLNNLTVSGLNFNTVSTGDTAPVTVTAPVINLIKQVDRPLGNPGEELTYSVYFHNQGDGTAYNLIIFDTVPPNTSYVPGSLRLGAADSSYETADPRTDDPDSDEGEVNGSNIIFTINTVSQDDGIPASGTDEGKIYFKVKID